MPKNRYVPNITTPLLHVPSPRSHLVHVLTSITDNYPPLNPWPVKSSRSHSFRGVFTGPTSIAYLFLHISRTHPTLLISTKTPAEWCAAYLSCGQSSIPFDDSSIGVMNEFLAYNAVSAAFNQDASYVSEMLDAVATIDSDYDPELNDVLYGRAGTLALLRIVRHFCPQSTSLVNEAMKPLISHMLSRDPWTWHGKRYIGAAHGDIGNLTQIILCDPSYAPQVTPLLSALLDMQDEDGNWPSQAPDPHSASHTYNLSKSKRISELVQFCHGAPGFIYSLQALRPFFPSLSSRIGSAVQKAQSCVWVRGLLIKEPNLCHGVTGNALVLPERRQREHFLAHATPKAIERGLAEGAFVRGDDPWGLWWGEAGRAWGWMSLDCEGDEDGDVDLGKGYPVFTDV